MKEIVPEEVERNRVKLRIYWIGSSSTKRCSPVYGGLSGFFDDNLAERGLRMTKAKRRYQVVSFLRKELITFVVSVVYLYSEKQGKNVLECLGQAFQPSKERPFYCLKDRLCSCFATTLLEE